MYVDECCEDTDQHAASGEHDDYPEVELLVGPVITLSHDDALTRYAAPHAGGVRGSQFEGLMGSLDRRGRWYHKGGLSPERKIEVRIKYMRSRRSKSEESSSRQAMR